MANSRREYFRKNRKTLKREQKQTVSGILSACFGIAAAILFVGTVIKAFRADGDAGTYTGAAGLFGLVFALGAVALAVASFREKNIRVIPPRTGNISGGILTVVFCCLYIYGIII